MPQFIFFRLLCVVFLLFVITTSHAQSAIICGTVKDVSGKGAIPFVNINIRSKNLGTAADSSGAFLLRLREEEMQDTLILSAIGYHALSLPVAAVLAENRSVFYLRPKNVKLNEVKVKAKNRRWKEMRAGYHIDKGSPFRYEFSPSDSLASFASGEQLGSRIKITKNPAFLQSISFGLLGSGNQHVTIGIRVYSFKNNLPHKDLLPEKVLIHIPPHHTGWITVPLSNLNITLEEDVAVVLEWQNGPNRLTRNSLMDFASIPKGQIIYYRATDTQPWQIIKTISIGIYATLVYEI